MRKLLITTFFVAILATPAAAQNMGTTTPATMTAPKPVAMAPAPARPAPRPAPVMARPAAMKPVAMTPAPAAPAMAPAPVMRAPAMAPAPATMAPSQPAMSAAPAAPDKKAPAGKKDSKGSVVGGWLLQLLLGILGIALPIILTPVVMWLLKKMKVEDQKAQMMIDEMVDKAIGVGIHYAEEQAHKLKDNPVDSAKKLDMAGEKAQAYLKDSGVVDKGANYLKDLIEAKLGEKRTNGGDAKPEAKPEEDKEKKEDDK